MADRDAHLPYKNPAQQHFSNASKPGSCLPPRAAGSGACLAVHFGAWVWSLQRTSLTHSLLLVSTTPVIMAAGALALRHPISKGEVGGAVLALVGTHSIRCVLGSFNQV